MIVYLYAAIFLAVATAGFGVAMTAGTHFVGLSISSIIVAYGLFRKRRWTESALFGAGLYISVNWFVRAPLDAEIWSEASFNLNRALTLILALAYCVFLIVMWLLVRRYFRLQVDHDELSSNFS